MAALPDLSLTDWVVLGVVAEGATHGWAVARELGGDGDVGRIWTVRGPLVYRALDGLLERELVEACGEERGTRGPVRTLVRATRSGHAALRRWLGQPVAHVRDVRTELLVKLVLLRRAGLAIDDLVDAQREQLAPVFAALARAPARDDDVLARWRRESARATRRFLDSLATRPPR